jgi:RNA polymerase sigma factor (sigma-70 family)
MYATASAEPPPIFLSVEFDEHFCRVMAELRPRMVQRARRKLRLRDDAEDVVNSALQSAWHYRGNLQEKDKVGNWIWGVFKQTIVNHCHVRYTSQRDPKKECSLTAVATVADPSVSPEDLAIKSEEERQLWQRIAALPEKRRKDLLHWMRRGHGEGGRMNHAATLRVWRTIAMLREEMCSHRIELARAA